MADHAKLLRGFIYTVRMNLFFSNFKYTKLSFGYQVYLLKLPSSKKVIDKNQSEDEPNECICIYLQRHVAIKYNEERI